LKDRNVDIEDVDAEDCVKIDIPDDELKVWEDSEIMESIRNRFVTGDWAAAARRGESHDDDEEDDSMAGDFEDLETGEKYEGSKAVESLDDQTNEMNEEEEEERKLKKLALKARFDAQYPLDIHDRLFHDELEW
jgi:ribosome biogenesis protein BMS1